MQFLHFDLGQDDVHELFRDNTVLIRAYMFHSG